MQTPSGYLKGVKQTLSFYPKSYASAPHLSGEMAVAKNISKVIKTASQTIYAFERVGVWRKQDTQSSPTRLSKN
jgi:hypothetical protein